MKQKIIKPDKGIECVTQRKSPDNMVWHSADEIGAPNIYSLGYSDPFMPIMDLSFVFDELKKMVNSWFLNKSERTINKKKGA
ncbi:hypothetical protein HGH93_31240 [Chitinophaga polysaccharea]|uniref:hypothetical protein n=1 Tax=Chitinophaga TaxID=79328 RepID=UPI00145508E3|nr:MULTISPECIES: hypothetical protein [Chitinophaga]NLR62607.1 hypothetical protein [Chitinophaga polysaccharea]NLU91415.1 hypothetical protein [Chitinophaga sp. Ak27]